MAELKKLGRYELRRVLGKGAMGVVYEGYDPTLSRRVAVKTILSSVALDDETERAYAERFEREAKAVARLNHPHIVQVHDFGGQDGVAYLVMEFIEGRELRSYFERGERFDAAESVRIMGELLEALAFAHQRGVVHRDVKPANVMLDAQRRVKLADFGVARLQDSKRSAAGTMVGTPAFMSPEQISGGKVDGRTDIFSAGTILYQLLTGEQPFKGEGAWTVAKQIMENDPPAPSTVVTNISPEFDAIVDKALAKNAADRFASAEEFAAALRGAPGAHAGVPLPPAAAQKPRAMPKASETELEFWRAIQNSTDAKELEFYLEQFPDGTYAGLARHKISRLRTAPAADDDATVALPAARVASETQATLPPPEKKSSYAIPAAIAAVVVGGAIAAYLIAARTPVPAPIAVETPAKPQAAPAPAVDADKIRRETEERMRKEFSEKAAAERAALEKAVAEKLAAERAAAERVTQARTAADRAVAEKMAAAAAAERIAAEKIAAAKASERAAAERAAADHAAAERAAAEKAAAEKAAAEKAAADKAAAEKLAAAKAASANSVEAQLERFIQRKGRARVLNQEPIPASNYSDPLAPGEVVYVNDGACPPGRIREVTGTPSSMGSYLRQRPSRCISLAD